MKTIDHIAALYESRRNDPNEKWRREAVLTRALMNGEVFTPTLERPGMENEYANVANTALTHMEGMAKRITSTQPSVRYASLKPGQVAADERARKRQLANLGWWDKNNMKLIDRKRVRYVLGYGMGPVQIGSHEKLGVPKWNLRDPLSAFAAPTDFQDNFNPSDCIFAYQRNYAWIKSNYPDKAFDVSVEWARANNRDECRDDQMFEVLEYIDAEERVIVILGRPAYNKNVPTPGKSCLVELDRTTNRLGLCPVVNPHLINIDRLKSSYVGNFGMYIMRNKLAALEYEFAEKTVWPDTYLVEPPGSHQGEIVDLANGRDGIIGHVKGGQLLPLNTQMNFAGTQMMDRLEREERVATATPAEWGGESASNIRTGERGRQIVQAATDYTIQEIQEIFVMAKEQENRIAVKVDKTYHNTKKSFYVGWEGFKTKHVDYTPSEIWETDENHVFYAASGSDMNSLVISGGQRIAQQTMSRESFMALDPLIEDSEVERDRIQSEALHQAGFMSLMQPGALDPVGMAEVARDIKTNRMEWYEAVEALQKRRQEAQATSGEPGTPTGPVDPNSPEAQPGIAPEAASGISAPQGVEDLASVLGNLRRPQMTVNGA